MTISASMLARLSALGMSRRAYAEVLAIIAEIEGANEERRAKDRARKIHGNSTENPERKEDGNSTEIPRLSFPDKERSPTPPKEINPSTLASLASRSARDDLRAEFDGKFWPDWPHKVGKPAAFKAFCTARKTHDLAVILFGLDRYVVEKPADRPWLNPATFLNQERFNDRPASTAPGVGDRRNGSAEPAAETLRRSIARTVEKRARERERQADPDGQSQPDGRRAPDDQGPYLDLALPPVEQRR